MYEEKTEEWYIINIIDTENEFDNIIERFTQVSSPTLSYNGEDSPFGLMMSSELSFNILNETAEDGKYIDLFTGQENRWLIEVRKRIDVYREDSPEPSISNFVFWKGFLLPDVYSEPYTNGVFFVDFTATDGLSTLKTKDFNFPFKSSVIQYISYCLRRTGLALDLYIAPNIRNANYTSWNRILLPIENFDEKEDARIDCYTALEKLLKAIGAVVYQHRGSWYVVGHGNQFSTNINFEVYDAFGNFKRNHLSVRKQINADFDKDTLSVRMQSPFKKVKLNVDFETEIYTIFPEKTYLDANLNPENVENPSDVYPTKAWVKNGNTVLRAKGNDPGLLSVVGDEGYSEDVSHVYLEQGSYPFYKYKEGVSPAFYVPTNVNWNYATDYIELKSAEAYFVSPKKPGSPFSVEIDIDIDYMNYPYEDRFENGYYLNACRVDFLVSNTVILSTRKESDFYDAIVEYEFEDRSAYGDISIYEWPNFVQPAYVMPYSYSEPKINANIKASKLDIDNYGKFRLRIYIPKTRDGQNTDYRLMWTQIRDLSGKVIGWEDERFVSERLINYSTEFERDLDYYDGKNDFYKNLFDIGYVQPINPNNNYISYPYTRNKSESDQFYIWTFPSPIWPSYINRQRVEYFRSKYNNSIIKNGNKWMRLSYILGKLDSKDVFIEIDRNAPNFSLKISKSLIMSLTAEERELFLNHTDFQVENLFSGTVIFPPHYNQFLSWESTITGNQGRYLDIYAKMIHEMQATPVSRAEGVLRKNITPHDLVKFNWKGNKLYTPVRLTLNLSENKTDVLLVETKYQEINDYVTTD